MLTKESSVQNLVLGLEAVDPPGLLLGLVLGHVLHLVGLADDESVGVGIFGADAARAGERFTGSLDLSNLGEPTRRKLVGNGGNGREDVPRGLGHEEDTNTEDERPDDTEADYQTP